MIELQNTRFGWPDSSDTLTDVSFTLNAGEKAVLLGANGSGKSTLLKLLNGLVVAQGGSYRYDGTVVDKARLADREWLRRFRQEVVLLFQHPEAMLFNPTVRDEIAYGPKRLGHADADARAEYWASQLQLTPLLDKAPFTLSGGQKQKVALAAILIMQPKVILMDEPSASLDPRSVGWLLDFLQDTDAAVLVSTHNLAMAQQFASRCLVLDTDGRLAHDGALDAALNNTELLFNASLAHHTGYKNRY